MSEENLGTVRREYAALATRDWETLAEVWHPDVEYEALDPATYHGFEEMRTAFMGWSDLFVEWWVELDEIVAVGEQVAVIERYGGRGMKGSGAEAKLEQSVARLISFQEGRIRRSKEFRTLEQALKAAEPSS
jgi:ketosteroid isomerase-like protein